MSIRSSAYAQQNQHFTSEVKLNWDCLLTCIHKLLGFLRKFYFCSSAGEGTHLKCNLLPCMWQLKFSCGLSRILLLFSLLPTGGLFNDLFAFIPAVGESLSPENKLVLCLIIYRMKKHELMLVLVVDFAEVTLCYLEKCRSFNSCP